MVPEGILPAKTILDQRIWILIGLVRFGHFFVFPKRNVMQCCALLPSLMGPLFRIQYYFAAVDHVPGFIAKHCGVCQRDGAGRRAARIKMFVKGSKSFGYTQRP